MTMAIEKTEKNLAAQHAVRDVLDSGFLIKSGESWASAVWQSFAKFDVEARHRMPVIENLLAQELENGTVESDITATSLMTEVTLAAKAHHDKRISIQFGDQIHREVVPVIDAIGSVTESDREVFQRDGQLVEIVDHSIRVVPRVQLKMRINAAVNCLRQMAKGTKSIEPPNWLVEAVESFAKYDSLVRRIDGVITTPTMRADGTILQTPGYDPATLLYYKPSSTFPTIPEQPTRDEAVLAGKRLLDVVGDSPFRSPSDRSAWLSLLLTVIARSLIEGPTPFFAVVANTSGTGKTIAVQTLWEIVFGRSAACTPYPASENEMRKSITTAVAVNSDPMVLFDNIDRPVGGASLDSVLTAGAWKDRELGASRSVSTDSIRTVFALTGNNVTFKGDIVRRVLPIRLRTDRENPADRTDWKHKDILAWTKENRTSLVVDALTLLRG
ncbi:MAG: hypothetical protein WBD31_00220, partial [Rubripirellula sp.]